MRLCEEKLRFWCGLLVLAFFFCVFTAPAALSKTIYVNGSMAAGGDGTSWQRAYVSLDDALSSAVASDVLWVAAGTYRPVSEYGFSIPDGVSIYGGFSGSETSAQARNIRENRTIFNGDRTGRKQSTDQAYNVIQVNQGKQLRTFDGLTITGGVHGIYAYASQIALKNCIITLNGYMNDAEAMANAGGAGLQLYAVTASVESCVFSRNRAGLSTGIDAQGSTLNISKSVFADNYAEITGASIGNVDSDCTVVNSVFYNNRTQKGPGPGVYSTNNSTVVVTDSTFYNNFGPHGTCICSFSPARTTAKRSILMGNTELGHRELFFTDAPEQLTVASSLLPSDLADTWTLHSGTYGAKPADGGGNIVGNPGFTNPADPDGADDLYATSDDGLIPTASSSAVDAVIATDDLPAEDILGSYRLYGNAVDMGAYEYGSSFKIEGNRVATDLWIGAVIRTEEMGSIEAVWQKGGEGTTAAGDRVIWGYFYASPNQVNWGSSQNPDVFVKIWFDHGGRLDVNFFHVSVPDIDVYSDYPYDSAPDKHGVTTMTKRYIRQYYENGIASMEENEENGNPPAGDEVSGSPGGYDTINDLNIGALINTVEKGRIDGLWYKGGQDTTPAGHQVLWGYFHASASDVAWGSPSNPDLFVKIWFDAGGRIDVNFFHVSVPDIEVYSDYPRSGQYNHGGTTMMRNRYIRHEFHKFR